MIKQLKTLVLAIGLVAGMGLASTSFAAKPKEAAPAPAAAAPAPEAAAPAAAPAAPAAPAAATGAAGVASAAGAGAAAAGAASLGLAAKLVLAKDRPATKPMARARVLSCLIMGGLL